MSPDQIQPIEPIEPYQDEGDTVDEEPPVKERRGKRGTGGATERVGRRTRPESMARVSRFESKGFFKRFIFSALGAAAVMGVQIALAKEFALAEMGSRSTMGYVVTGGIAAGILVFSGIFAGLMAPRSYCRGFLIGAAVPAIAGLVLSVLPAGTLPVEAAVAEGADAAEAGAAPVRGLLTAVNPKFLESSAAIEKAEAESKAAKADAKEKVEGLEKKLEEAKTATAAAEEDAQTRAGEVTKAKEEAAAEKARADVAEKKIDELNTNIDEQKKTLADAGAKLKVAEGQVSDLKTKLAEAIKAKDAAAAAGSGTEAASPEEIEKYKLRLDLAKGQVAELQKKLVEAEQKAKKIQESAKPEWMSAEEYEKLRKVDARSQARIRKLLPR